MFINEMLKAPILVMDSEKIKDFTADDQISFFFPSPSGRYLVFGMTRGGSERSVMKVYDTKAATLLPGSTDNTQYPKVEFLPDESGFLYVRHDGYSDPDPKKAFEDSKIRLHKLSSGFTDDKVIVDSKAPSDKKFEPFSFFTIRLLPDAKVALLSVSKGTISPSLFFFKPIHELESYDKPWNYLGGDKQNVTMYDSTAKNLFYISFDEKDDSTLHRVGFEGQKVIQETISVDPSVKIVDLAVAKDGVYVVGREGLKWKFLILTSEGRKLGEFVEPLEASIEDYAFNRQRAGFYVEKSSINSSREFYEYQLPQQSFKSIKIDDKKAQPRDLVLQEHWVVSKDGTKVPLLMVAARSTRFSKDTRMLVNSYAAYGNITMPRFDKLGLDWFEKGGVRAFCLARGGGELGESWHKAAQGALKKHTIDDNIACAEYIISQSLSSPEHMAFIGGSAGGVIAGNLITQRPDLYKAVVVTVGVLNLSRNHLHPNGPANMAEFGNPAVPEEAKVLRDLDAYLQIREGKTYPSVLISHGYNDSRLPIWMSSKFAARLQKAQAGPGTILMKTNFDAGHGLTVSSVHQQAEDWADIYTFLARELKLN